MIYNPSEKEQEYFLRMEMDRLKTLREEHRKKQAEEDRKRLKELHFMHCTKCGQAMATTQLHEIEVEICPDCGGIYLDAGELDKLLEERTRGPFTSAVAALRQLWGG